MTDHRHNNYMLAMRRMMKEIAMAMKLEQSFFGKGYWRVK